MPRPPGTVLRLTAKEHLGPAPGGGSGAQLYKVMEEECTHVVKFKGTNQGIRILFNEYVSGRLGELIGVPFGDHALIDVSDFLHPPAGTPNIRDRIPGIQFSTTYFQDGQTDRAQLRGAVNFRSHFPGVPVFDTFIARGDSRQYVVYSGSQNGVRDTGAIFDQGFAFTGSPVWTGPSLDADNNCVANDPLGLKGDIGGFADYDPFIQRVELLTPAELREVVYEAPLAE